MARVCFGGPDGVALKVYLLLKPSRAWGAELQSVGVGGCSGLAVRIEDVRLGANSWEATDVTVPWLSEDTGVSSGSAPTLASLKTATFFPVVGVWPTEVQTSGKLSMASSTESSEKILMSCCFLFRLFLIFLATVGLGSAADELKKRLD
jgi:hypothetical protein